MPDPRDDLIRRGDVLDMIDAESHGDEGLAIIDSRDILALPADPVAAAALALAEAIQIACGGGCVSLCFNGKCDTLGCRAVFAALSAYRSALAGRERGRRATEIRCG